jgi:hypothetical protein
LDGCLKQRARDVPKNKKRDGIKKGQLIRQVIRKNFYLGAGRMNFVALWFWLHKVTKKKD